MTIFVLAAATVTFLYFRSRGSPRSANVEVVPLTGMAEMENVFARWLQSPRPATASRTPVPYGEKIFGPSG
ncbi:MAG TPA: hypothetical protein VKB66_02430 [Candidatus Acidoferrum sp.]|nr:hypothetical protein [Candidatus Acidoferrum sp.]